MFRDQTLSPEATNPEKILHRRCLNTSNRVLGCVLGVWNSKMDFNKY